MKKLISLTLSLVMLMMILPTAGIMSVSAANSVDSFTVTGTESLYSSYDYSDPNYITDEDFFGKWNSSTGTWTKEPYFNYTKYPALAEVEAAAKAGNYTLAGEKITEYYKNKFLAQPRTAQTASDASSVIAAKLATYNMYGASEFTNLDIITLPKTAGWVSADVTSIAASAAKSTSGKKYTFQIAAAKNDGIRGRIYSRESNYAPYVKATVNGVEKTFSVVADTYIRGGSYANTNYGTSAKELHVEEGPVFTNCAIKYPEDTFNRSGVNLDNVMRARLTVDFTGLKSTDTVTDARLYLRGSATSEKPVVVQFKSDLGGSETDTSWTWAKSYRYYMNYTGLPGIVAFAGDNSTAYDRYVNGNWAMISLLSEVYRATGDETYAYHAFRYWMNHIKYVGDEPARGTSSGTNWYNNLALGTRSSAMPVQFFQLATSKYFTAENVVPMLKYAWMCGDRLVTRWNSQSESGNWGTYETAGLSNLVVNFKEFKVVDDPIQDGGYGEGKLGGWKALVNQRYYVVSGNVLRPDGSFTETLEYGRETLNNFLKYPQYAEQAGETAELEAPLLANLKAIATYILNNAGPDFCSTQYGDSIKYDYKFSVMARDTHKYVKDPFILWAGTYKKQGSMPSYTSLLYPDNRKAALKTGWDTNDLYVDFVSDATLMSHNHADDLNIGMFCYGQPLLVDSLQYSYGTNDPKRIAVYATNNHNTLSIRVTNPTTGRKENLSHYQTISGLSTGPKPVYSEYLSQENWDSSFFNRGKEALPGTIHRSELNNGYDYVEMSHQNYEDWYVNGYDYAKANVNMKRSLLVRRNAKYMIVTDYVKALDTNDYTVAQNWHFMPGSNFTIDSTTGIAKTAFSDAPNVQIIPVKAASAMDYVYEKEGYYCPSTGVIQNNPYPAYEKSGSGDKVYNTIILPTDTGVNVNATATNLTLDVEETVASASHIAMTDTTANKTRDVYYYFLHDTTQKAQRTFGTYSTDAKMALVEYYDGAPVAYIVQDGTNIKDTESGNILVDAGSNLEELSITIDGSTMYIDSSKTIDLTTLAVRSEVAITKVCVNGVDTEFTYNGNYVYFGEAPDYIDLTIDFAVDENIAYGKTITAIAGRYWGSSKPSDTQQWATDGDMTTIHRGNGRDANSNITGVSFTLDLEDTYALTEFALYIRGVQTGRTIKVYKGTEVSDANLIATITSPENNRLVNGMRAYELKSTIDNVVTDKITVVYSGGADFGYKEIYVKGVGIEKETIDFTASDNLAYGKKVTPIAGRYWSSSTPTDELQLATDGDMTTAHKGNGKDASGNQTGVSFTLDLENLHRLTEFALYIPSNQPERVIKIYNGDAVDETKLIATITSPTLFKNVNGKDVYEFKTALDKVETSKLTVAYSGGSDFYYNEISVKGAEVASETVDFTTDNLAYGKKVTPISGRYWNSSKPSDTQQLATDGDMTTSHRGNGQDADGNTTGVSFSLDLGGTYKLNEFSLYIPASQPKRTIRIYNGDSVDESALLATIESPMESKLVNGVLVYELRTTLDNVTSSKLTVEYRGSSDFAYIELRVKGEDFKKETIDFTAEENIAYGKTITHVGGHYYSSSTPSADLQLATDGDVMTGHYGYGVVNEQTTGVTFSIDLGKEYDLNTIMLLMGHADKTFKVYKGTSVDEANLLAQGTPAGEEIKVNGNDKLFEKVTATFPENATAQYLTIYYPYGYGFSYYELYITGTEVIIPEEPDPTPDPDPEPEEPDNPPSGSGELRSLEITVDTATGSNPVSLLIYEKDADITKTLPLYINQKNATNGVANFVAKINSKYAEVDVYAGNATYAQQNGTVQKIGTVNLGDVITEIAIVKKDTNFVSVAGKQQLGSGVSLKLDIEAPENVYATHMIWAIRYMDKGAERVKYTEPIEISEYYLGAGIRGSITLGLAFLNGFKSVSYELESVEIVDVDAIFLFTNGKEIFTNENDAANKKK